MEGSLRRAIMGGRCRSAAQQSRGGAHANDLDFTTGMTGEQDGVVSGRRSGRGDYKDDGDVGGLKNTVEATSVALATTKK
jgi:hypothetical protein